MKPPAITIQGNIEIGFNVTLQCTSSGYPIPRFYWFKMGNDEVVISNKSFLELIEVSIETSGLYKCIVNNGISKEEKSIELVIPCKVYIAFCCFTLL